MKFTPSGQHFGEAGIPPLANEGGGEGTADCTWSSTLARIRIEVLGSRS